MNEDAPDSVGAVSAVTSAGVVREDLLRQVTWGVDASVRYHERRQAFYERADSLVNALNLIIGSGAVLAIVKSAPDWIIVLSSALVAVLSLINITMRSSAMASLHAQLKQRFIGLLIRLEQLEDFSGSDELFKKQLRKVREARLLIEVEEPTIYRVVHVMANNEIMMAHGYDESEMWQIPRFKALTANWIRWESSKLKRRG